MKFSDVICEHYPILNECLTDCRETVLDQLVHLKRPKIAQGPDFCTFVFALIFPNIQPDTADDTKLAHAQTGPGDGKKTDNYN